MFRVISMLVLAGILMSSGGCNVANKLELDMARKNFFEAWTKPAGQPFTTNKLADVVETSDDFLSFDGMNANQTVIESWKKYESIWLPGINQFVAAKLSEQKMVREWASDNLAITASIAHIQADLPDGKKLDTLGHLTLGWQRKDGKWVVVHEHMSLGVKE